MPTPRPTPRRSAPGARRAGLTRLEALVGLGLVAVWAAAGVGAARALRAPGGRVGCADHLRRLGVAALQYADDRRFFPHVRGLRELDGDLDSPDTPRKVRRLVAEYVGDAGVQVCPASDDDLPLEPASGPPGAPLPPLPEDRVEDPTLRAATALSYGWSRRLAAANTRCLTPLAADRASRRASGAAAPGAAADGRGAGLAGNHVGGSNVLHADGAVEWVEAGTAAGEALDDVELQGPALSVAPPVAGAGRLPEAAREGLARAGWGAAAFGPPALLGALLLGRALRRRGGEGKPAGPASAPTPAPARGGRTPVAARPVGAPLQPGQRCPLCHDGVAPGQALTACPACGAAFHAACAPPGAACSTLGCG